MLCFEWVLQSAVLSYACEVTPPFWNSFSPSQNLTIHITKETTMHLLLVKRYDPKHTKKYNIQNVKSKIGVFKLN